MFDCQSSPSQRIPQFSESKSNSSRSLASGRSAADAARVPHNVGNDILLHNALEQMRVRSCREDADIVAAVRFALPWNGVGELKFLLQDSHARRIVAKKRGVVLVVFEAVAVCVAQLQIRDVVLIAASADSEDALVSVRVAGVGERVRVVGGDDVQRVLVANAVEGQVDGVGELRRFVQRDVSPRVVVAVVDAPALDEQEEAFLVCLKNIDGFEGHLGQGRDHVVDAVDFVVEFHMRFPKKPKNGVGLLRRE